MKDLKPNFKRTFYRENRANGDFLNKPKITYSIHDTQVIDYCERFINAASKNHHIGCEKRIKDLKSIKLFEYPMPSISYAGKCWCGENIYKVITDGDLVYPAVHESFIKFFRPDLLDRLEMEE
ncbi:hypothetical protein [Anaerococcus hydrogenalis]|uniref:Uncharacterized protein n=1 Tax=Anaerococcus hydrogenalis ACS-025-V-Sch4 TaxID=879306 RepID=F0H2D8_9FIRM|nr:hypothetical protein [Anaerococcus hydrogenalis]EGC83429.1 hypothetical protein HMPREF9246_0299 [Anaerococcus hydrogenalis ACS-025-V-Sch4]